MRALVIAARLLPFALSFRRDFRRWVVAGRPAERSDEFHERRAAALVRAVAQLGPTFVKLAQVFAARPDVIPERYARALGTLTDRVPPEPWPVVERQLAESYGRSVDELFEDFDTTPIAAGSLGQVYRARLAGRDIVVKVLRPGVERRVAEDVAAARRLVALLQRRSDNPHLRNFRSALEEFAARVGDEMDFRKEAEYAAEIRARFERHPRVIVPAVVPELTRQRAMVMEYVEGTRIDAIGQLVASGRISGAGVVRAVIEAYAQMMLQDGVFHADPHPGNLLVRADGALVLLDFGMCVRVRPELRRELVRTVLASIRRDPDAVVEGFQAMGLIDPGADLAVIRRLVVTLFTLADSGASSHEAAMVLADEVMAELYNWPVTLPGEMVYFARVAALVEGIGVRYVPAFNGVTFAAPVVLRMRREILASVGGLTAPAADDWAAALGAAVGDTVRILRDAGREIAKALASRVPLLLAS